MSASLLTGPLMSIGPMGGSPATSRDYTHNSSPSLFYEGQGFPDQRFVPIPKDNPVVGSINAHFDCAAPISVNAVPSALAAANIVAAATGTSGTAMTLAAASTGVDVNIPIETITGAIVIAGQVLDFGFDKVATTAGSKVVTPAGSIENYRLGEEVVIAGAGNTGGTAALLTYITAVGTTTITVNDAAQATIAAASIGMGNNVRASAGAFPTNPTAHQIQYTKGSCAFFDPAQSLARGWRVVSNNAADAGWTMTVTGYDLYGQLQTEALAVTANGTTWGRKTFKSIVSAIPTKNGGGVSTGTFSVGTSDLFGFAYRALQWEFMNIYWAGAILTASTGFVAGDTTTPATSTTKDPRGTIQIGTNGPSGSGAAGGASNGTLRLMVQQTIKLQDMVNQSDQTSMFFTLYGVPAA